MHGEVQRVLAMQQALGSGAWVAFLGAATHAPYLQGCLAHMYFPGVRARALSVLASTGARSQPMPSALRRLHSAEACLSGPAHTSAY